MRKKIRQLQAEAGKEEEEEEEAEAEAEEGAEPFLTASWPPSSSEQEKQASTTCTSARGTPFRGLSRLPLTTWRSLRCSLRWMTASVAGIRRQWTWQLLRPLPLRIRVVRSQPQQ